MKELDYTAIFAKHLVDGESHRECVSRLISGDAIMEDVADMFGVNFRTLQSYVLKIDNGLLSESREQVDYLTNLQKYLKKIKDYLKSNGVKMKDSDFVEWLETEDAEQLIWAATRLGRL